MITELQRYTEEVEVVNGEVNAGQCMCVCVPSGYES